MKKTTLTADEESVLLSVKKEPLTSFQILKKADNITLILSLYNVLDKLKSKDLINSYIQRNQTYHFAA